MTVLYINGQLCDLPTDFRITLVQENLYFSSASTYTYDIELPITPYGNNAKIFTGYNRADKRIANQALPARLIVDNRVVLNGSAIVVGTSERSVRVQLLQGNSELNWKQRLEATYIDELDLGNVSEWGFVRTSEGKIGIADNLKIGHGTGDSYYRWPWNCIYETTNGDVCTTPIFNSESGEIMNALTNDIHSTLFLHDNIAYPMGLEPNHTARPNRLAAQPKFKVIFEKIIAALGLSIRTNQLTGRAIYDNIYIANSTEVWLIADMLPHLTVVEFFEQVQLFFNCVVKIEGNSVAVLDRKAFYADTNITAATAQQIAEVVDEYTADIETDTQVADADKAKIFDISYENFGTMFLGHNFDNVKLVTAAELTNEANPNVFATNYRGHKVSSPYLDGTAVKGNEIDRYQSSPSDGKEEATLKFIPIEDWTEYYFAGRWGGLSNLTERDLILCVPTAVGRIIDDDTTTIQDLLDEGAAPEEKATIDRLCLGFRRSVSEHVQTDKTDPDSDMEYVSEILQSFQSEIFNAYIAVSLYPYVKSLTLAAEQYCLSMFPLRNLDNTADIENLYKEFYAGSDAIKTSVRYTFKFCTSKVYDALQPFIIHNQHFAAQQIKYYITARGFEKIAEGDFYKL